MNYLKNHCWCNDSNWGGHYDCQIIVGLSSYEDGYIEDWERLVTTKEYFSQKEYERNKKLFSKLNEKYGTMSEDDLVRMSTKTINQLKPEVLKWLEDNIGEYQGEKGWCVGSDEYVANDACSGYSIFFQRRKDAMKFIKIWSKWKKPIHYCQYFTDVRKRLNLETGKYETV